MRQPFIFTSLGIVRGESKRGNRKCGLENTRVNMAALMLLHVEHSLLNIYSALGIQQYLHHLIKMELGP